MPKKENKKQTKRKKQEKKTELKEDKKNTKPITPEEIKAELEKEEKEKKQPVCIVCKQKATHCMRGIPENTYCEKCAKDYFKLLSYLDKL